MIRRILVGAAIAAAAFGFSASAASADVTPGSNNAGPTVLSGFQTIGQVANTRAAMSLNHLLATPRIIITRTVYFNEFDLNMLSNRVG